MVSSRRAGRPRAASRELLEEAACELFLERGYDATSVADITSRAGVSRSTFFNYVDAKSDLLWARFDDAVDLLRTQLAPTRGAPDQVSGAPNRPRPGAEATTTRSDAERDIRTALATLAATLPPENVAFAYAQAEPMGLGDDLRLAEARRLVALREVLATHLRRGGLDSLSAQVRATALAGALLAALREWAVAGVGRPPLAEVLTTAFRALADG